MNAEQLIREIFSEENLILEEKITEELVIRDTVPDLPEEIRGVGAETADMDGDKYILNLRADGSLAGAAVLPSPIDFLTGSINEVIWDRSSVKYDVRGGQGDPGHYTFQVCFSKDPYGKGYLYEEEISAASTFLSGDREFFYYYEEGYEGSCKTDVLSDNMEELEALDPAVDAARISASIGKRKKQLMLDKASELGIKVLNANI